jgi:hypothetical protein
MTRKLRFGSLFLALAFAASSAAAAQNGLVDDSQLKIASPADVRTVRARLIRFIWGTNDIPTDFPQKLTATPVSSAPDMGALPDGTAIEKLSVSLPDGFKGFAYYLVPANPNAGLVVVHQGHYCNFVDGSLASVVKTLLENHFSVLAVYMPGSTPADALGHAGFPIRSFFDTTVYSLAYARKNSSKHGVPSYRTTSMVGLSGGGWATTVYAALDPTIRLSFPVAGSIPLYLRARGSGNPGDGEQYYRPMYEIAGYLDLYALGSSGEGRKQVQILNVKDTCCFAVKPGAAPSELVAPADCPCPCPAPSRPPIAVPESLLRAYESQVRTVAEKLGGSFRLEVDSVSAGHFISTWAMDNVILPELNRTLE